MFTGIGVTGKGSVGNTLGLAFFPTEAAVDGEKAFVYNVKFFGGIGDQNCVSDSQGR